MFAVRNGWNLEFRDFACAGQRAARAGVSSGEGQCGMDNDGHGSTCGCEWPRVSDVGAARLFMADWFRHKRSLRMSTLFLGSCFIFVHEDAYSALLRYRGAMFVMVRGW